MNVVLRAEQLAFSYSPGHKVLDGISFELHRGELINLLGCNGCGKTTLLDIITGMSRPSAGRVLIKGKDVKDYSAEQIAKEVSIVYQEHSAPFPYEVIDVVRMGRTPYISTFSAPDEQDARIAEQALQQVGLFHLANRPYTQISGGERQMVLIARALAQQTDIILLDEPTSHLDFRNQAIVIKTIHRLVKEREVSVLMTTHMPYHALIYSSKAALMKDGKLLAFGQSQEVINDQNLSRLYEMGVHVLHTYDDRLGAQVSTCVPIMDSFD